MRRTLWRCLVGLLVLGLSAAVPARSLQFYTEEYPPLNYSRDGRPVGLAVDLVRELFERTGDHGRISVVPWARGYQAAQLEPNTALFVTMRTAERERLFKWVGPVVVVPDRPRVGQRETASLRAATAATVAATPRAVAVAVAGRAL